MSQQERVSWVALVVNTVIGYWYFERVFSLPADADLFGPGMAAFAVRLFVLLIVITIACEVALRVVSKSVGSDADKNTIDERDRLIDLKAVRNAYGVLSMGIVIVVVQVVQIEWAQRYRHLRPDPQTMLELIGTGPLGASHVVQLLLLALTLAAITVYASRIFHYRRGY
jgi:hypothetical protein